MRKPEWPRVVIFLAVLVVLFAGLLAGHTTHVTGLKPVPGGASPPTSHNEPSCNSQVRAEVEAGKGHAGVCAPTPQGFTAPPPFTFSRLTGPDTSNNDPIFNWFPVRQHGHQFAWTKLNQGVFFIDSTASGQVKSMRAAYVLPGGYDFLEVCRANAQTEGRVYSARVNALQLTRRAVVPMGDAEWPLHVPCSASRARSWISEWKTTVARLTHINPGLYTGAWWWDPNVGCWWPGHTLSWISGYGVPRPALPCGLHHLDVWQYTDTGWNGAIHADLSVLFVPLTRITISSAPAPRNQSQLKTELRREHALLVPRRAFLAHHHCRQPPWHSAVGRSGRPNGHYQHACNVVKGRADKNRTNITELERLIK